MSQLGHSLCRTPRGELRGFPCRRVVSMAVDAAIAVSWPVAEALAERLCRIMVWLLRLALMRATDLARADACGPTAGMLVRQPIDPPASARADTPGRPRHAPKNSVTLRSAQTPRGRRVPARWRLERCDKLRPRQLRADIDRRARRGAQEGTRGTRTGHDACERAGLHTGA